MTWKIVRVLEGCCLFVMCATESPLHSTFIYAILLPPEMFTRPPQDTNDSFVVYDYDATQSECAHCLPTIKQHNSRSLQTCEGTPFNNRNNNEDRNAPLRQTWDKRKKLISYLTPRWTITSKLASSIGRALHRCRKGHGFKSCPGLNFFQILFQLLVQ